MEHAVTFDTVIESWNMQLHLDIYTGSCKQCYVKVILNDMIFIKIFKSQHNLYITSVSDPPPPNEKFWL